MAKTNICQDGIDRSFAAISSTVLTATEAADIPRFVCLRRQASWKRANYAAVVARLRAPLLETLRNLEERGRIQMVPGVWTYTKEEKEKC
jgi:hypothetical protein